MKPIVRNIIYIVALVLICVGVGLCVKMSHNNQRIIACNGTIKVSFSDENKFLTEDDIKKMIDQEYGVMMGQRCDSVNLDKIEKIIDSKSGVLKSEAYLTKDGTLNIMLSQRKPVVRFQKGNEGLYADAEGKVFPLMGNTLDVPLVDGILPPSDSTWTKSMAAMAMWIAGNKDWSDIIVQIHSSEDGDLTLIPRQGKEKLLFGQPDKIASKFARLEDYYRCIVPAKGEDYYSTVSVKFDGQIVCRQ